MPTVEYGQRGDVDRELWRMTAKRILVCGGYGAFGRRAAERLGADGAVEIILAGRNLDQAERAVAELQPRVAAKLSALALDAMRPDMAALARLAPTVIYNASGPFQAQDYTLARAAIAAGAHYVDLADARAFVVGISALDAEAKAAGLLVVSGASSVPALSSAVLDAHLGQFTQLERVFYGIVPGNGFDPGLATTASILSYVGKPFATLRDGAPATVHGWQGISRYTFPKIGPRWLAHCDIPDLALFPARYPTLRSLHFTAGLEVSLQFFGMWGLSWLVRAGVLPRAKRLAGVLLWAKTWMTRLGSDASGMVVAMDGIGPNGKPLHLAWHLIARNNHGPFVPQAPATALVRKLLAGRIFERGAMPCLGLLTLDEIAAELGDLSIEFMAPVPSGTAA